MLSLLCILWGNNISGQQITIETAENVSKQFFINKGIDKSNVSVDVKKEFYEGILALYIINFNDGGWAIVSANKYTKPILAYGEFGVFSLDSTVSPSLISLINAYKQQSLENYKNDSPNKEWNELLAKTTLKSMQIKKFREPLFLLYDANRGGEVSWNQGVNINDGCNPSYNKYCPVPLIVTKDCDCEKTSVGCGAVAMGQIMWKWKWPLSYNWNNMPIQLQEEDSNDIPLFLRDCGAKSKMNYNFYGSWTTIGNLTSAFHDFGYKSATYLREKWWANDAWYNIIKTELDCGRPVLFRGGEVLDTDIGNVHYFVIEGYDYNSPGYFYINWGWGKSAYHSREQYSLPILRAYYNADYDYSDNQMAIVGISPTISNATKIIKDVAYNRIMTYRNELALESINLPMENKSIIVENGATYILKAKESISLNVGFEAKEGCEFSATIDTAIDKDCGIELVSRCNAICRNTTTNHSFVIFSRNANSYIINVYDRNNHTIYQDADLLKSNTIDTLWNGEGLYSDGVYMVDLQLFNNCGETYQETFDVTALSGCRESSTKSYNIESAQIDEDTLFSVNETPMDDKVVIYPNPTTGRCYLEVKNISVYSYKIYNSNGQKIIEKNNVYFPVECFDIPDNIHDYCVVEVEFDNQKVYRKLILKK